MTGLVLRPTTDLGPCGWTDPHAPGGATCNRPEHGNRWHREVRDGETWAEWSGGQPPEQHD